MLKLMQSLEAAMAQAAAEGPPQAANLRAKMEAAREGGVSPALIAGAERQLQKLLTQVRIDCHPVQAGRLDYQALCCVRLGSVAAATRCLSDTSHMAELAPLLRTLRERRALS